jgi:hypothetical protein
VVDRARATYPIPVVHVIARRIEPALEQA